ncbi:unnamed protein product [Adineta steineri]|uniref:G-protein coupled receptors family 1 profile domain-containing protein n=1 Tax=Adineta steineri TaxID=433720 RepID=A0A815D7W4_9BILA|nr:unnamed protein product [Adineta steineri]CAF1570994.1 unnamed protein product [Adineta steineri]
MTSVDIDILNNICIYLHRYISPILYIIGNYGTIVSVIIFFKKSWKKNVCVFYFLICLLINFGYINSTLIDSIFTQGYNIYLHNSSIILCKISYYVTFLFGSLFPNNIILASIDRLLISSQNTDTRLYSSKRLAYFSISTSTFLWIIFYIHVLIKINIYEIYPFVFICYYETSGFYFEFISYSNFIIVICFSIILIILSILTFKNVRDIRTVSRQQRHQFRTMNKKDFQLLRCLYIHNIVFIIFNIFPSAYYVYLAATKSQTRTLYQQAIDNFLNGFSIFLHHIPYCTSFFIFLCVSKAFRQEIKRLIYKMCGKQLRLQREDENRQGNNRELNVVSIVELPF